MVALAKHLVDLYKLDSCLYTPGLNYDDLNYSGLIPNQDSDSLFYSDRAQKIISNIDEEVEGLWDKYVRPLRDSAVRLCAIDDELNRHKVIPNSKTGLINNYSQRNCTEALRQTIGQGKFIDPGDVIELNEFVCDLSDDSVGLIESANKPKEEVKDSHVEFQLRAILDKIDQVKENAELVFEKVERKLNELMRNALKAMSDVDTFFKDKTESSDQKIGAIKDFLDFVRRLILRVQTTPECMPNQREEQVIINVRSIEETFLNLYNRGQLDRELDYKFVAEDCNSMLTVIIREARAYIQLIMLPGLQEWHQKAEQSYKAALRPYLDTVE